jgi:hypothetical protein
VGGSYFNPAAEVLTQGRRLGPTVPDDLSVMNLRADGAATYLVSSLFHALNSDLVGNELLFAAYLRGSVLIAPFVWDEERLIDFEQQVRDHVLQRRGFYGVHRDIAEAGLLCEFAPAR